MSSSVKFSLTTTWAWVWRAQTGGAEPKANILLSMRGIVILSLPNPEAGQLRDCVATSTWYNHEGQPIYKEGEATSPEKLGKVYTPVFHQALRKVSKIQFDNLLVSQNPELLQHNSNLGSRTQVWKMAAERSEEIEETPPSHKKEAVYPLHHLARGIEVHRKD